MTVRLRDGSEIEIRPIAPDDRQALAEGFERLSPESRYRRFFGPMPRLRARDLDYLTQVDHHDHEALVAVDPASGDGVGVARYVRTGPEVAEPAMVVADDWQGRGVASRLLDALVERAQAEGIARFEAPVLAQNTGAIRVLERVGATTVDQQGREVKLTVQLPRDRRRGAEGLATLLRQFATGALLPARTLLERLWPRRRGEPGEARRNVLVVGADGTDNPEAALDAAAELAGAIGAAVEVVGAHPFLVPGQGETQASVRRSAEALRERGLRVGEQVRRGDPALVLADVADEEHARMIVVGAGGGGMRERLLGSVAELVAERAPCDVLIVR